MPEEKSFTRLQPVKVEEIVGDPEPKLPSFKREGVKFQDSDVLKNATNFNSEYMTYTPGLDKLMDLNPNANYIPGTEVDYTKLKNTQTLGQKIDNAGDQFFTNFISGLGQAAANTLDISSWDNSDFDSSLFGISTRDMREWAENRNEYTKIYTEDPNGGVDLSDPGWWLQQTASAGTGVSMGIWSLAETAAIEALTGGVGTGAALARLGNLFSNIRKAKGATALLETANLAKEMRSTAMVYSTLSRVNESRMEAASSYDEIKAELEATGKFSEEEIEKLAHQGAKRTFMGNMALLPLDYLSFRAMVFNPVSGSSTGMIEKGLEKAASVFGKGKLGKAVGWGLTKSVGMATEGLEEGFQNIVSNEGNHYAKVQGGIDDGTNFLQRLGQNVKSDEFWNNFAGGVIGSPIIGGVMNLTQKATNGSRGKYLNQVHSDYLKTTGRIDDTIIKEIARLDSEQKYGEANDLRKQFFRSNILNRLHLDALTDKDTAFNTMQSFMQDTLDNANQNKSDSLYDLGFNPEQKDAQQDFIKKEFPALIQEAAEMKAIYNTAKNQYNPNILPTVVNTKFNLSQYEKDLDNINNQLNSSLGTNEEFAKLSTQGKRIYDIGFNLDSLNFLKEDLKRQVSISKKEELSEEEITNLEKTLATVDTKINAYKQELSTLNSDESYTNDLKEQDDDIIKSMLNQNDYSDLVHDKNTLEAKIVFNRKQLGLLSNKSFVQKLNTEVAKKGTKTNISHLDQQDANVINEVAERQTKETSDNIVKSENTVIDKPIRNDNLMELDEFPQDANEAFNNISKVTSNEKVKDTLKSEEKVSLNQGDEVNYDLEDVMILAPKSLGELDDNTKRVLANSVNVALSNMPDSEQTFYNLAKSYKDIKGIDSLDKDFNALIVGWEASGRPSLTDYGSIHKELTTTITDAFNTISAIVDNIEAKEEDTIKLTVETNKVTQLPDTFDDNNQPIVIEDTHDNPVKDSSTRLAFTNTLGKWIVEEVDGVKKVTFQKSSDDLVFGEIIDSRPLLNPDKFREGTKLTVAIPSNYKEIPVAIFSPSTGEKIGSDSFGVVAANLEEGSQEWLDKVPMIVYEEGNPRGVAFIHDTNWYNIFNTNVPTEENINGQRNTRALRNTIYNNYRNGQPTELVVTEKTETTVKDLVLPKGELIPYSEGNPQIEFVKVGNNGVLTTEGKVEVHNGDIIIESSPRQFGWYYGLARYGTQNGTPSYLLEKMFPQTLSNNEESIKTLKIFGTLTARINVAEKFKIAANEIRSLTGIDVTTANGVSDFLKQFIPVQTSEGLNKRSVEENIQAAKEYINLSNNKLKGGSKFVMVTAAGQIIFGTKGSNDIRMVVDVPTASEFGEFVKDMQHSISDAAIRRNLVNPKTQFVQLNSPDGKSVVVEPKGKYTDYLKTQMYTNIKAINISTEDKPLYVNQVQPTIKVALPEETTIVYQTQEQVDIISPVVIPTEVVEETKEKTSDEQFNDLFSGLDELGIDLNDVSLLSPRSLSEEERNTIGATINRVAGLTPQEQSNIENFIYQQVVTEVAGGDINKPNLRELIANRFNDVLDARLEPLNNKLKQVEAFNNPNLSEDRLIELNKLTRALTNQISKIEDIKANFDALYTNASKRISNSEYIVDQNDDFEIDDYLDESYDEDNIATGRDFAEDNLRVNPYLKLTSQLKFLFEGIVDTDDNGTILRDSFGLAKYRSSEQTLRYLQEKLVNHKSDYNVIVNTLNMLGEKKPWVKEIVNRLNATTQQNKNLFVKAMSNRLLTPKFILTSFNKKTKKWDAKLMDTHRNGLDTSILKSWKNNFFTNTEFLSYQNGVYNLNKDSLNNLNTEISNLKNLDSSVTSLNVIQSTLSKLGIDLNIKTISKLKDEVVTFNYTKLNWEGQFVNPNGLFRVLSNELNSFTKEKLADGITPLDNSVFKTLATIESEFNEGQNTINFRDNGKAFFGLIVPRFVDDRFLDVTSKDSKVRDTLRSLPFSKESILLRLLQDSDKFRTQHKVNNVGDTAFKQNRKNTKGDASITALSPVDHEQLKIGMFTDLRQGNVTFEVNGVTTSNYPNSNIRMRLATMLMPSLADKSQALFNTQAVLDFSPADLKEGRGLSEEALRVVYEQTVKPDLLRMIDSAGKTTNIDGYEVGKHLFTIIPKLNYIQYTEDISLIDHIRFNGGNQGLTIEDLEANETIMKSINTAIEEVVLDLAANKKQEWLTSKIVEQDENNNINFSRINGKYIDKFTKNNTPGEAINMFALDYVTNNLISNANAFMVYAGDPALYYKSKAKPENYIQRMIDTYDNMNKRLASLIAPAAHYPNGENEKYYQLFLQDRVATPDVKFLKFITKLHHGESITDDEIALLRAGDKAISKKYEKASAYFSIDSTDAQEYTTWKEHLSVLERYGVVSDAVNGITQQEIDEARKIFTSNVDRSKLTDSQLELIKKVMQPIKPRYVGDYFQDGVMRRVYIKTSSFPLIPQLTQGFEIDNLRQLMENKEKEGYSVRASYHSGNKVGAVNKNNALKIWNDDGTFRKEVLTEVSADNSLLLNRIGWGIQQDVPFKSEKEVEDKIRMGTQLIKLLFGDNLMELDGFTYKGQSMTGREMQNQFTNLFNNLIDSRWNNFNKRLKLSQLGNLVDKRATALELGKLLRDEAIKRNFPLSDIEGLSVDQNGDFQLPLWASNNSNRYESLLNSIVETALIKIKFPGYSYVAGSSEGFKGVVEEQDFNNTEVIYTKHWNGSNLQMTTASDGKVNKAQVFLPSKFKDKDHKLVDLFSKNSNGEYTYIEQKDGKWNLKEGIIEEDLLNIVAFRIPTSSIGSAATVEIAGFIPYANGDLMVVPSEFTKQKGMDFDVDKEYTYHYWHSVEPSGKIVKIDSLYTNENIDEILGDLRGLKAEYAKELSKHKNISNQVNKLEDEVGTMNEMGIQPFSEVVDRITKLKGNLPTNPEALIEALKSVNQEIKTLESHKEKIIQNDIINLMQSVLNNPNPEVQAKINNALSIDYAKDQADIIDGLRNQANMNFTGASDMYQKEQFFNGVSGKIGTGAYSLDVVFHSLAQQSAKNGNPLRLVMPTEEGNVAKRWNFGNTVSSELLGQQQTIDGDRTITEVNSEQQNISVDNGKEKVLGKININNLTMDVDKVFNLTGLDKGDKVYILNNQIISADTARSLNYQNVATLDKISYVFLSQPIIREYVEKLKNSKSVTADFIRDREKVISQELINKYAPAFDAIEYDDNYWGQQMSIANMAKELINDTPNGPLQAAILMRFLDMKKYGEALRGIQGTLNVDSKGLDKSFFNTIEKLKTISNVPNSMLIENADKMIGDFTNDPTNDHIILPSGVAVKPETISGKIGLYGLKSSYELIGNFLPYDSAGLSFIFDEVISQTLKSSDTESTIVEQKQDILREFKKFIALRQGNGIIENADIEQYRKSIYIDDVDNISLASYIKKLIETKNNPVIEKYIKSNPLINRFEFDNVKEEGKPALLKFNNTVGESYNEQELYNAFSNLLSVNYPLPKIGNKQYTTDTLAQALIDYCHLGNFIQEAIQFTKYIPSSYYNLMGYTDFLKNVHNSLIEGVDSLNIFNRTNEVVSGFTTQYIQHNPSKVKAKLPSKTDELNKKISNVNPEYKNNINNLSYFTYNEVENPEDAPNFMTIYNAAVTGDEKQQLYMRKKGTTTYTRIPVLGTFGLDEYNPNKFIASTIVNEPVKIITPIQWARSAKPYNDSDLYSLRSENIEEVIKSVAGENNQFGIIANELLPYVSQQNIRISVGDIPSDGMYNKATNSITISEAILRENNKDKIAKVIVHETVHALTANQIDKYIVPDGDMKYQVKANAPTYASDLIRLYNVAVKNIGEANIKSIIDSLRGDSGTLLSPLDREITYGGVSIYEFISLALTEPAFQKEMNKISLPTGDSLWSRFVKIIESILSGLGASFNPGSVQAAAFSKSFELIATENQAPIFSPSTIDILNQYNNREDIRALEDQLNKEIGIEETSFNPFEC